MNLTIQKQMNSTALSKPAVCKSVETIKTVEFSTDYCESLKPTGAYASAAILSDFADFVRRNPVFAAAYLSSGYLATFNGAGVLVLPKSEELANKTKANELAKQADEVLENSGLNLEHVRNVYNGNTVETKTANAIADNRGEYFQRIVFSADGNALLFNLNASGKRINQKEIDGKYHSAIVRLFPGAKPETSAATRPTVYSDASGKPVAVLMPYTKDKDRAIVLRARPVTWDDFLPGARSVFCDISKPTKKSERTIVEVNFKETDTNAIETGNRARMTIETYNRETTVWAHYGNGNLDFVIVGTVPSARKGIELCERLARRAYGIENSALEFRKHGVE